MANFGQLMLTNAGIQEQYKAQGGAQLKFKRIAMGSGTFGGNVLSLTALVNENVSVPITKGYISNAAFTVEGFFSNEGLATGFAWREIGVFVEDANGNDILYCYANAGDTYDYIPATADERYTKNIRVMMAIGNATNVTIVETSGLIYVDTVTFNEALEGKAPNGFGLGAAATDISNKDLIAEVRQKSGFYRGVNVINAPNAYWWYYVVTAGVDTTNVIAFGTNGTLKTAHFAHTATEIEWKEFASLSHTHSASDINSGTLTIARGGTGATNASSAANSLGVATLLTGTSITDGADLNNYTTVGNYCCGQSADAVGLTNCPTQVAFTMKVFYANGSNRYIGQEITEYSTGVKHYRLYYKDNNTWGGWESTYSTASPVPTDGIKDGAVTVGKLAASAKSKGVAVTLAAASWSSKKQTVSVNGVTASNNVLVSAAPASREAWNDAEIYCSAQAAGSLTFTCGSVPAENITANVVILI